MDKGKSVRERSLEEPYLSVVEGGVGQFLLATYGSAASALAIRMNLAHSVYPEKLEV